MTITGKEIKTSYERDGYAVVRDLIDDRDLEPMRDFIKAGVDGYIQELYAQGKLSSTYADESFEGRYASICRELDILPRNWGFGSFGREFYDLYNNPAILGVLRQLLGLEVTCTCMPAIRTKLPGSVVASFPWHQDSLYIDQSAVGRKEKHTELLHMVTVWVPLVEATVENGCCWVIPGSFRWGLLDGARGEDLNVRMEEDVEARGTPVPIPLEPGGALFMSNLCVHTSKVNRTRESRWSIDVRYYPTPGRADMSEEQRQAAEFVHDRALATGQVPLVVLSDERKPTWEEWEARVRQHQARHETNAA